MNPEASEFVPTNNALSEIFNLQHSDMVNIITKDIKQNVVFEETAAKLLNKGFVDRYIVLTYVKIFENIENADIREINNIIHRKINNEIVNHMINNENQDDIACFIIDEDIFL
ncbi:hypothetical protein CHBEV_036 [Choristoneura biennis entomopoxvirus]|uniref:Uncharacterized protein n=1 Tax=Choristoneura biennis entomopoxvirus TaxID=10288 RepID=A0A916P150_CBEPV|nr:hypothetical protein CHBEV_036 [Choristoneura biennis entomopoxvirus]CCU55604.1 hypothetical protein CHBEV_036 [Choristoneura biennis entomopoxvirus]